METLYPPVRSINFTGNLSVTAKQCCEYCIGNQLEHYEITGGVATTALFVDYPSCGDAHEDIKFRLAMYDTNNPSTFDHFLSPRLQHWLELLGSIFRGYITSPDLAVTLNNTFKALYHAIRLDLGVIRPYQIYNNSTQFNASIADYVPHEKQLQDEAHELGARAARASRDYFDHVDLSNHTYSVHVPDILYLTSVFKLKPLPQAIAAVFVATFSMLSAIWAVFNFVASSFVTARSKHG